MDSSASSDLWTRNEPRWPRVKTDDWMGLSPSLVVMRSGFLARDLEERVLFLWVPPASCGIVNDRASSEGEPRWMF